METINRVNNNINVDFPNLNIVRSQNYCQTLKVCPFTFILFLSVNFVIFIMTLIKLDLKDFSISIWPILYKHQYYRTITHHFLHIGLVHISFNMAFFYFVSREMEKKLGSAYVLSFITNSVFLISLIYLAQIITLKYFITILLKFTEYDYNFYSSAGFSEILFCLYYIECSFKNSSEGNTLFFGLIPVKRKLSPLIYLIFTQVISPNSSLIGHLSGIFAGYLLKNLLVFFVTPRKESIEGFEAKFKPIIDFLVRNLNYKKITSLEKACLDQEVKEIDKNFCEFFLFKYFTDFNEQRINNERDSTQARGEI